jgi:hypothetical protein
MTVQFSTRAPNADYLGFEASPEAIVTAASKAEEVGFDAIFVNDHIIVGDDDRSAPWTNVYDPFVAMSFIALRIQLIRRSVRRRPLTVSKPLPGELPLDRVDPGRMSQIKLIQRVLLAAAVVFSVAVVAPLYAAEPATPTPIIVTSPSHATVNVTTEDLARLPMVKVDVAFLTEHGKRRASFEGPLLWTVLQKAGAVDPARPRGQVSRTVVIIGTDGYRAVLALAEISPEFEGKQVILAERMDRQLLGAGHLRIVVPLDKRGGRSVRDVAHIEVTAPPP